MKVAYFKSVFATSSEVIEFEDIIEEIRSEKHYDLVREIRSNPDQASRLKKQLPIFSPAFTCRSRTLDDTASINGIMQFDYDVPLSEAQYTELMAEAIKDPHVYCAFRSPSAKLKLFILTDFRKSVGESLETTKQRFGVGHDLVGRYIFEKLGIEYDRACRSISQTCFVSYDSTAYLNPDCKPFLINQHCSWAPEAEQVLIASFGVV